jgi:hypothetical protein
VRWCEGRSGTEDRTPLDILVVVELAFGFLKLLPDASTREMIEETEEMLIGIVVRSVTSKKSCALDGSPSCERNARQAASRR